MRQSSLFLTILIVTCVFCSGFGIAWSQEQPGKDEKLLFVPYQDLGEVISGKDAQVFISLKEYNEMKAQIKGEPDEAGPAYAITRADYSTIPTNASLEVSANIQVEVFSGKPVDIPLLYNDLALENSVIKTDPSVKEGLKPGAIRLDNGIYVWHAVSPGKFIITLEGLVPVSYNEGKYSASWRIAEASSSHLTAQFTTEDIQVEIPGGLRVERMEKSGSVQYSAVLPAPTLIPTNNRQTINTSQRSLFNAQNSSVTPSVSLQPHKATLIWKILPKDVKSRVLATSITNLIITDQNINGNTDVKYSIQGKPVDILELIVPEGIQVQNVKGADIQDWRVLVGSQPNDLNIRFAKPVQGSVNLQVEYTMKTPENTNEISLKFPAPIKVERLDGYVMVAHDRKYEMDTVKIEKASQIPAQQLPSQSRQKYGSNIRDYAAVVYEYHDLPVTIIISRTKIEPYYTAVVEQLLTVGDATVADDMTVRYDISKSSLTGASIRIPKDMNVFSVTGRSVQSWVRKEVEGSAILQVDFKGDVYGQYEIQAKLNMPYKEKFAIPAIEVEGASSEKGFVGIRPLTNVELTASQLVNMNAIDVRELPSRLNPTAGKPTLIGLRYLALPYAASIEVKRYEDVQVLASLADSLDVTTVLAENGTVLTEAIFMVKNTQLQYLELNLPEDSNLWSSYVDGTAVKPAKGLEGHYLLPLVRAKASEDQNIAFPVKVVYALDVSKLGWVRRLKLQAPSINLPINSVSWSYYAPEKYRQRFVDSNLREGKGGVLIQDSYPSSGASFELGGRGTRSKVARSAGGVSRAMDEMRVGDKFMIQQQDMKRDLSTAIESYYVDHNVYPKDLDELTKGVKYIDEETLNAAKQQFNYEASPEGRFELTGIIPLDISVPRFGVVRAFSGNLIVPKGTNDFPEIYVKAWLMPSKVISGTNWIIYIAVFLIGLVFLFRSQPGAADIFITLVIILASGFVWLTSWGGITGNLPLVALVYFVLILLLLLRKRRRQRHEATA